MIQVKLNKRNVVINKSVNAYRCGPPSGKFRETFRDRNARGTSSCGKVVALTGNNLRARGRSARLTLLLRIRKRIPGGRMSGGGGGVCRAPRRN